MPTIPTLLTFAAAATLLIIVPGPNVIFIIARGIDQGRRAAVVSALGGPQADRRASYGRLFGQGLVVNILNPKVGLFFIAFLPQFIDPSRGSSTGQILVLGAVFAVIGFASDMVYAFASGSIGAWLRRQERIARQRDRFAGAVYILLGVAAALSGSGSARSR